MTRARDLANIADGTFTATDLDLSGTLTVSGDANFDSGTLFVDVSENKVGIGTTSPTDALSVGTLGSGGSTVITIGASTTGTSSLYFGDGTGAARFRGYFDYVHSSDTLVIGTSGSEKARIDSSGNVAIGSTNAGNAGTLNLSVGLAGTTAGGVQLWSPTNGTHYLQFGDGTTGGDPYRGAVGYNHTDDALLMLAAGTERMRITSAGNVGIGTSSPSSNCRLHVTDADVQMELEGTAGSNSGFIDFDGTNLQLSTTRDMKTGAFRNTGKSNATVILTGASGGSTIRMYTAAADNTAATERARITSTGNFLVGKTSAVASNTDDGVWIAPTGYVLVNTTSSTPDSFNYYNNTASAYRFYVTNAGVIFATSTSISAISDASLKENVRDLDKGLDTILALKPRRFDWKNGDGNDIMGFVAQEVQEALPELVHDYKYNDSETKLGLKMGDMIPSLVKAIQEQQEIINDLRARMAQLEGA